MDDFGLGLQLWYVFWRRLVVHNQFANILCRARHLVGRATTKKVAVGFIYAEFILTACPFGMGPVRMIPDYYVLRILLVCRDSDSRARLIECLHEFGILPDYSRAVVSCSRIFRSGKSAIFLPSVTISNVNTRLLLALCCCYGQQSEDPRQSDHLHETRPFKQWDIVGRFDG